jgi:hypothetical protein
MLGMLFRSIAKVMDTALLEVQQSVTRNKMHEDPEMPNYGKRGQKVILLKE